LAKRLKAMGSAKYQNDGDSRTSGPGFGVTVHEDALIEPLRWRKPRRVFVNSMSDLAHARVNDEAIARVFAVMGAAAQHEFQVLTKRPRRLAKLLARKDFSDLVALAAERDVPGWASRGERRWPLPNVWIGTSIESDEYCWRADELRRTPAAIRCVDCTTAAALMLFDLRDQQVITEVSCKRKVRGMSRGWWWRGSAGWLSGPERFRAGSCKTPSRNRWSRCGSI
jgi:protein gp37